MASDGRGTSLMSETLHSHCNEIAEQFSEWLCLSEILEIIDKARDLMLRCDGAEGARADGSNVDTLALHDAFDAYDSKVEGWLPEEAPDANE